MSTTRKSEHKTEPKYASPVYAAAGIGDLAVEQLRKLPTIAGELRDRATAMREGPSLRAQATEKAAELSERMDVEKFRAVVMENAQKAAERAVAVYGDLVARGTKVVGGEQKSTAVAVVEPAPVAPVKHRKGRFAEKPTVDKTAPATPKAPSRRPKSAQ